MGGVWERQIPSAKSILAALLKIHGHSLKDEGLRTPAAEKETIIKSRPLTLESLSDVNSEIPLSPSNLLTMKSDVIMPPPVVFNRPECSILWNNILTAAEKTQKSLPKLRTTIKEKLLSMANEIIFA